MNRTFPETLSVLRHERNISQRTAAAALNISQALLSHYENGAREPGLQFVCRACDYYGVTADYLLCRSDSPDRLRQHGRGAGLLCQSPQPDRPGRNGAGGTGGGESMTDREESAIFRSSPTSTTASPRSPTA